MTIQEIITQEKENPLGRILLHPEGIFYKAYERSAFAAIELWGIFKTSKRFYKCTGMEVVSLGFPISSFEDKSNGLCWIERNDKIISVETQLQLNEESFNKWKSALPLSERNRKVKEDHSMVSNQEGSVDNLYALVNEIQLFPIETSSPLECMIFLSKIKQRLTYGTV